VRRNKKIKISISLITVIAVVVSSLVFLNHCSKKSTESQKALRFEIKVFELTNAERVKYNLPPFIWHDTLAKVARDHSEDMAKNNFVGSMGSDKSAPRERIERAGVIGARSWGENVIANQSTPETVFKLFMNSPDHRANIFSLTSSHIGVGYVKNHWTQCFVDL